MSSFARLNSANALAFSPFSKSRTPRSKRSRASALMAGVGWSGRRRAGGRFGQGKCRLCQKARTHENTSIHPAHPRAGARNQALCRITLSPIEMGCQSRGRCWKNAWSPTSETRELQACPRLWVASPPPGRPTSLRLPVQKVAATPRPAWRPVLPLEEPARRRPWVRHARTVLARLRRVRPSVPYSPIAPPPARLGIRPRAPRRRKASAWAAWSTARRTRRLGPTRARSWWSELGWTAILRSLRERESARVARQADAHSAVCRPAPWPGSA
jgi:hypothetical protein